MRDDANEAATVVRRVFPSWSVSIPATFAETFVDEDGYWHAWDEHRSLSLSSFQVTDGHEPVAAEQIVDRLPPPDGTAVDELPPGLLGWAIETDADPPARASRSISGMLATDGLVLLATITSDDRDWARRTWLSVRWHPVGRPGRHEPPRATIGSDRR